LDYYQRGEAHLSKTLLGNRDLSETRAEAISANHFIKTSSRFPLLENRERNYANLLPILLLLTVPASRMNGGLCEN